MKKFVTNSKNILPVDEKKYLKPFLTSTNINTRYWESPPENNMSDTYLTSKLMQIHQLLDMFKSLDIDFKNKNFLDIVCTCQKSKSETCRWHTQHRKLTLYTC